MPTTRTDAYRILGPSYDWLCRAYSAGHIDRCRAAWLDLVAPGDSVLFAGVGHGREAATLASRGARVTGVDLSTTMLERVRRLSDRVELIHSDILEFEPTASFDWVFANFFLNVFDHAAMPRVLQHLARQVRPGGHVIIGDFRAPDGGRLRRALLQLHWYVALLPFALAARNAFHPIYDYRQHLAAAGLTLQDTRTFGVARRRLYWSLLTQRPG